MARANNNVASRARRKKRLKLAKGYYGSKHTLYRTANEQIMRSQRYAYIGRKQLKREMRKLWITRINAGARMNGISYSQLTHGLRLADIQINRKMLSEMAIHDEKGFAQIVEVAKKALENKDASPKKVEAKVEEVKAEPKKVEAKKAEPKVVETKEAVVEEEVKEAKSEAYAIDTYGKNWQDVVFNIVDRHLGSEFTDEDVLEYKHIAAELYPKNNTLDATIKRNLKALVEANKLVETKDGYKKA